jgi:hypothetical protein
VWAETGEFEPPLDPTALADRVRAEGPGDNLSPFVLKAKEAAGFGIVGGDDVARDLGQAGWAVLFGPSVGDDIKQQLQPLLERRSQLAGGAPLFQIFSDYIPGQTAEEWLKAAPRSATMQVVDPEAHGVPYYILIVAPPEDIPFDFQFELDVFWAVGRLWFTAVEDFGRYARSVVAYEEADAISTTRELALFGTKRDNDRASLVLAENVFDPWISSQLGAKQRFRQRVLLGADATKANLLSLVNGESGTPALLFTGSHGALFGPESKWLEEKMGALICQDWPGGVPARQEHCFAASDVSDTACLHGMIHFMFCCYGGGWPHESSAKRDAEGKPVRLSPRAMLARLPQALLGRERGALAVVAHVDAAYGYSYTVNDTPQNQSFKDVLVRLMAGQPVGHATDQMNLRWSAITSRLLDAIGASPSAEATKGQQPVDASAAERIEALWVARADARSYVVLGDPAVRLRVEKMA